MKKGNKAQETDSSSFVSAQQYDNLENTDLIPSKSKNKLVVMLIVIGFFVLVGGASASYNAFVLNNPDIILRDSLNNTKKDIESLLSIPLDSFYTGGKVNGNISISSPVAASTELMGGWYENHYKYSSSFNLASLNVDSELISFKTSTDERPQSFLKISGLDSVSPLIDSLLPGFSENITNIDESWIKIDYNMLPKPVNEIKSDAANLASVGTEQIREKLTSLLSEKVLTSDKALSPFVVHRKVGKERFNDSNTYKYILKIQKENLKLLLRDAMIIIKDSGTVDEIELVDNYTKLLEGIDSANLENVEVEMWVDLDERKIRNLRLDFSYLSERSGYMDIGVNKIVGDETPLYINLVLEEKDISASAKLNASINKLNANIKLSFDVNSLANSQSVIASGVLNIIPSNEKIDVSLPKKYIESGDVSEMLKLSEILSDNPLIQQAF